VLNIGYAPSSLAVSNPVVYAQIVFTVFARLPEKTSIISLNSIPAGVCNADDLWFFEA
jgi:hypothetical protein